MDTETKTTRIIRWAIESGYHVDVDGNVVSPHGSVLKQRDDPRFDYKVVTLGQVTGVGRLDIRVHRLVAYQVFGETVFTSGIEVRHLDGNGRNNRSDNLALGTHVQNALDRPEHVRLAHARHASSYLQKISDADVERLRADQKGGMTNRRLREKYGISKAQVSYIVNYRSRKPR